MWRFIILLVILILSVWTGLQIAKDPGVAYFSYRHWSAEMPLWFAILCFILFVFLIYLILRGFSGLDRASYRFKNWLKWRRKYQSETKTYRGFLQMIEERWKNAESFLLEGVSESPAPLVNYLALAYVADEEKAFDRRDTYLQKAHTVAPKEEVAIGLTQARLHLSKGELEQALATLSHLRMLAPKHPAVLKLLQQAYIDLGDFKNLLNILPNLYKTRVLNHEQYVALEKKIYEELLKQSKEDTIWKNMPRKLTRDPDLLACYVKGRLEQGDNPDILEEMIWKSLKKMWHKNLSALYGEIEISDVKKQLKRVESLLNHYINEPTLLLIAGKISMRTKLWGKARSYLSDSIQLEPTSQAYYSFGKLLEQLGDPQDAMQSYREGLSHAMGEEY